MAEKRGEPAGSAIANKLILKKALSKKIKQIRAKAFITEREVYDMVRGFFKKYLGIDYEFTCEELMQELKKVYLAPDLQERVRHLFDNVARIEHTSKPFSREELEKILDELQEMVDALIVSHYQKEKSFFKKLGHSIHRFFSRKHMNILDTDESVLSEKERIVVKMNMLLDNSKRLSDKDLGKSKQVYKELLELYNSLSDAKKKVYFQPVQELYSMIKTKEA